jgi:hypothetical protein
LSQQEGGRIGRLFLFLDSVCSLMKCLVSRPTSDQRRNDVAEWNWTHDQGGTEQRDADHAPSRSEAAVPARMISPLEVSSGTRADVDLGASETAEVLLSHVSVRAVEAVRLLMIDLLDLETLMKVIPSAWTTVPFAIRARMNEVAWLSASKLPGANLPPRTSQQPSADRFGSGQNDGHVTRPR